MKWRCRHAHIKHLPTTTHTTVYTKLSESRQLSIEVNASASVWNSTLRIFFRQTSEIQSEHVRFSQTAFDNSENFNEMSAVVWTFYVPTHKCRKTRIALCQGVSDSWRLFFRIYRLDEVRKSIDRSFCESDDWKYNLVLGKNSYSNQ